jgi:hypothetical protein
VADHKDRYESLTDRNEGTPFRGSGAVVFPSAWCSGSKLNVPALAVSLQVAPHELAGTGTAAAPLGNGGQRSVRNRADTVARGRETARYAADGARHAEAAAVR